MPGIKGKVVAITGASSGIGEVAALLLAEGGAKVVLGARRVDRPVPSLTVSQEPVARQLMRLQT
jgi:NADP-dependent 3-hydroxy acid dehydrogenase YdfG